ncbi:hypothetical protein [Clostridium sp. SHJSY1]|uniref:hypothetical protein n=1 Tax=Clostridium sp. SHJSY1 TaxID=2942483 RepID=UPI00287B6C74|nr:hypothetical protein [Clostridium sp. SHJSY1]
MYNIISYIKLCISPLLIVIGIPYLLGFKRLSKCPIRVLKICSLPLDTYSVPEIIDLIPSAEIDLSSISNIGKFSLEFLLPYSHLFPNYTNYHVSFKSK